MVTQEDAQQIAEAQNQLSRYLSDEIAPMIFAEAGDILLNLPPEIMAREIHSWVGIQLQGPRASAVSDYLLHSARKVYHLAELELIPKDELKNFMAHLVPLLIGICPERDRADVRRRSGTARRFRERRPRGAYHGRQTRRDRRRSRRSALRRRRIRPGVAAVHRLRPRDHTTPSKVERVSGRPRPSHRPHRHRPQANTSAGSENSAAGGADQTSAHIDRLNLLLDRWERVASTTATQSPAALNSSLAGAESALLSRIIDEVATSSRSSSELNNQLRYLNEIGVNTSDRRRIEGTQRRPSGLGAIAGAINGGGQAPSPVRRRKDHAQGDEPRQGSGRTQRSFP